MTIEFSEDYTVDNPNKLLGEFTFYAIDFIDLQNADIRSALSAYSNYVFPQNSVIDGIDVSEGPSDKLEFTLNGIYGWRLRWLASRYSYRRIDRRPDWSA